MDDCNECAKKDEEIAILRAGMKAQADALSSKTRELTQIMSAKITCEKELEEARKEMSGAIGVIGKVEGTINLEVACLVKNGIDDLRVGKLQIAAGALGALARVLRRLV